MPADIAFLEGGNPGTICYWGWDQRGLPRPRSRVCPAITPIDLSRREGVRHYFTESDDLRFIKGKHSWSMGGWLLRVQSLAGVTLSSAGNVAYPAVLAFLQDRPTQAIVTRNAPGLGFRTTEAAWYVQDDMKLRQIVFSMRITLSEHERVTLHDRRGSRSAAKSLAKGKWPQKT